jgi:hypothetical protein
VGRAWISLGIQWEICSKFDNLLDEVGCDAPNWEIHGGAALLRPAQIACHHGLKVTFVINLAWPGHE